MSPTVKQVRQPKAKLASLLALVHEYREKGKFDQALDIAKSVKDSNPGSPNARHTYAVCLSEAGRAKEALAEFRKGYRLFPSLWRFATSIAIELQNLGRYREAVSWAQRGVNMAPGDWRPLCRLAAALCNAGQQEESRPLLERLANGRCHEAWVLEQLGKMLFRGGYHQAASVYLARYLRRCPLDVQTRQYLVASAEHMGNQRWANSQAFRVVDDSSSDPRQQFDIGTRYLELHVPRFAIGHLALAAEHDPSNARIWCNLAWAELQIGRWDHAGFAAEQAVERDPKDPMGWCNLGDASWALGHLDHAVASYRTAVRVDHKRRTQAKSRLKAALAERKRPASKPVRRMT